MFLRDLALIVFERAISIRQLDIPPVSHIDIINVLGKWMFVVFPVHAGPPTYTRQDTLENVQGQANERTLISTRR
jgi:hypothetical protein